jgi:hypothetical protein
MSLTVYKPVDKPIYMKFQKVPSGNPCGFQNYAGVIVWGRKPAMTVHTSFKEPPLTVVRWPLSPISCLLAGDSFKCVKAVPFPTGSVATISILTLSSIHLENARICGKQTGDLMLPT